MPEEAANARRIARHTGGDHRSGNQGDTDSIAPDRSTSTSEGPQLAYGAWQKLRSGWDSLRSSWRIEKLSPTVLLCGLLVTGGMAELTRRFGVADHSRQESALLTQVSDGIHARLDVNVAALAAVVGLFHASADVTASEFARFYGTLSHQGSTGQALSGLQGVGFVRLLTPAQVGPFTSQMRAAGVPSFRIHPAGSRPFYTAVQFLEPSRFDNRQAIGFDMATQPTRLQAMQRAARFGLPSLSGTVELMQAGHAQGQTGVVLFLPVHRDSTVQARSLPAPPGDDALLGWAYAPLLLESLVQDVLMNLDGPGLGGGSVKVFDESGPGEPQLLFSTHPHRSSERPGETGQPPPAQETIDLGGRRWTVQVRLDGGAQGWHGITPIFWTVLTGGVGSSTVAAMAAHLLAVNQRTTRRALALSEAAAKERALSSTVFDASDQGIVVTDPQGRILMANNAFTQLTGYRLSEIQAQKASLLKSGRHSRHFYQDLWTAVIERGHWEGDLWNRIRSGEVRRHHLAISTVRDDSLHPRYLVGFLQDITERHQAEEMVRHQALHDTLTGLANRALLMQQLERDLSLAKRHGRSIGLLYLDLDGFKEVNDRYGHAVGDRVLQLVGQRLQQVLRQSDLLCRQGGDEFVVLVPDAGRPEELVTLAEKLVTATRRSFREGEMAQKLEMVHGGAAVREPEPAIALSASVGIARFPDHGQSIDALLVAADNAMYAAKRDPTVQVKLADPISRGAG